MYLLQQAAEDVVTAAVAPTMIAHMQHLLDYCVWRHALQWRHLPSPVMAVHLADGCWKEAWLAACLEAAGLSAVVPSPVMGLHLGDGCWKQAWAAACWEAVGLSAVGFGSAGVVQVVAESKTFLLLQYVTVVDAGFGVGQGVGVVVPAAHVIPQAGGLTFVGLPGPVIGAAVHLTCRRDMWL